MPFPKTIGEARTGAMLAERSIENDEVGLLKPHLTPLQLHAMTTLTATTLQD